MRVRTYSLLVKILLGLLIAFHVNAQADDISNHSYIDYAIGTQLQRYQEALGSNSISADSTPTALMQRIGMYTALGGNSGFYIGVSSPLQTVSDTEIWKHSSYGILQTNRTELGISDVTIAKSRIFAPGQQTMYGLRYLQLHFTRYDFAPGAGAQAFNSALIAADPSNPAYADSVAFEIPGCTNHTNPPLEGMSCDSMAIQEAMSSLSLTYAYKYDSFFKSSFSGPRYVFEAGVSIPIFYVVNNTSVPNVALTGSLGQGYGMYINAATSLYATKRFQFNVGTTLQLIHRNQITDLVNGLIYPDTDTSTLAIYTSFSWTPF